MDPVGSDPMEGVLSMQSYTLAGEDHDVINTNTGSTTAGCGSEAPVTSLSGIPGTSCCGHAISCPVYTEEQNQ